jgi:hypothetical protein
MEKNMKKEQKYEYVKSLRLAGYLMMNGFRILRINHNLKVKGKDIYVFEQSDKLSDCIFKYINTSTKEKYYGNNKQNNKSNTTWKEYETL